MAEMRGKDFPARLFHITDVGFEVVSVCVEVPNPGCGFGSFREASRPKARLSGFFNVGWDRIPVNRLVVDSLTPTLWWANGHREISSRYGVEVEGHPSDRHKSLSGAQKSMP